MIVLINDVIVLIN